MAKQTRSYEESNEVRAAAAAAFISSLRFSRPLQDLRAAENADRRPCPQCGKRRQYYCYDCLVVTSPASHPQPLQLPINVHVILHPGETRGKATTLPIATVSPQVSIHTYPTVPDLDPKTTLVLYPSASAVEIEEADDVTGVTDVVFVDSTWQQSKAIAGDERVKAFRHVKFSGIVSLFWRFQDRDPYHLATVEAIYHAVRRLIAARNRATGARPARPAALVAAPGQPPLTAAQQRMMGTVPGLTDAWYGGEADDLLFYYMNQYVSVQQSYAAQARGFTGKHFDGYVLQGVDWEALLRGEAVAIKPSSSEAAAKDDAAADAVEKQAKPEQPAAE